MLDTVNMFESKQQYLGDKDTFIDLEAIHALHMQIAVRLKQARQKRKEITF